jgi:hypothetical protein
MTTTDARRAPAEPRRALSTLKLYLTALLASVYLVIWWSLASRIPSSDPPTPPAPPTSSLSSRRSTTGVWYGDLPPSARPVVDAPAGWRVADGTSEAALQDEAPPAPVRVAPERARVRTRSS